MSCLKQYLKDYDYTYGFNGKEKLDEVAGVTGATYDYGFRIYDSRLGRFLSVDPLTKTYPELTPYQFASNTPVWAIDLDGLEAWKTTDKWTQEHVDGYRAYTKTKIEQYQAEDVEFDCANLAVSLLIGYAKDNGLPVEFTLENGKVFTNESESFNGYNIEVGDVDGFERATNNSTSSYTILNDLFLLEESSKNKQGNIVDEGGHVEIVREKDKNEVIPSGIVPTVSGSQPDQVPKKQKYINKTANQKLWNVMKDAKPNYQAPPPIDSSLSGVDNGG